MGLLANVYDYRSGGKAMAKEDEVRLIAYQIWQAEGCKDGFECDHWYRAEAVWEAQHEDYGTPVGSVNEFFAHPVVAGVELIDALKVGDTIRIKGHTTDLKLKVNSLQIERKAIQAAGPGDNVGIKVPERVRKGDAVYRVETA
jgi:translation elongation factor EF-1alpha